ncbi:hypothetical protein SprV_0501765000 [Sparganum proliferum]
MIGYYIVYKKPISKARMRGQMNMFRQIIFLTVFYGACGKVVEFNSTLEFKQDSDYVFTKQLHGHVKHIIVDGVNISKAKNGSHCVAPNDCWEVVKPERLLTTYGFLKGSNASFTVQPVNTTTRSPVGVQYKKVGTPNYAPLANGTRSVLAKEIYDNETLIHILLFSSDFGNVSVVGNITMTRIDKNVISMFGKTGVLKFDVVLFTGHLETKPRKMEIKYGNGRIDRITIKPSNKTGASVPILTFIDYENAFKNA